MEGSGLRVRDVVVLLDREQGGRDRLVDDGRELHAVLTLSELLDTLHEAGRIDTATYRSVRVDG
jgi:uridine monophosphate synthetase